VSRQIERLVEADGILRALRLRQGMAALRGVRCEASFRDLERWIRESMEQEFRRSGLLLP
jgi:hypothetical protein